MRTIEYGSSTHVPAFLTKLWKLVTDAACDDLISWSLAGSSFIIYDEIRFSKELLPMYFKHNNMASFVRQLNMYGFRKLSCIDQGGMHCYKNEIEFYHPCFLKGREKLLEQIKRKIPNSKSEEPKVKQEYIEELISNLRSLQGKQDNAEQNMKSLKKENKILWRHIGILTDRYSKQQNVIQQLLPFFMNMVRSSHEIALKRKAPLMIDEGDTHNKVARLSAEYYDHSDDQDSNSGLPSPQGNVTNRGPVIHDVTDLECSKMYPGTILCSPNSSTSKECEAIVDSPLSCNLESSEQTIDSPFTEPGSMETINILNQNYERRCRSASLSASMGRRPSSPESTLSSSPSLRTSRPSMGSYSSPSTSRIPPAVIIDETTSDVPFPGCFAPKMEDPCPDTNMYAANSMMNEQVPSFINKRNMSLLEDGTSSMMNSRSPFMNENSSMMNTRPPIIDENTSTMMSMQTPSSLNDNRSMMSGPSPPLMNESTMMGSGAPSPLINSSLISRISPQMSENPSMMSRISPPMTENLTMMSQISPPMSENPSMTRVLSPMSENPPMMSRISPPMSENPSMMSRILSPMTENPSMLSRISPPMSENPSLMSRISPPMSENPSMMSRRSLMNDGSVLMNGNTASTIMSRLTPLSMNENAAGISGSFSPQINDSPPLMNHRSPSLINRSTSSLMRGMPAPSLNEQSSLMSGQSPTLLDGRSDSEMRVNGSLISGSSLLLNDGTSSSSNTFTQTKKELSEMNWMMNQNSANYTSEAIFENWLGQIMKSENISPGVSMPQKQPETGDSQSQGVLPGSVNYA